MSTNIKLLDRSEPLNENNFLDYTLAKIAEQNASPEFHAAIERLTSIREVLVTAKKIDKLQNIGNWTQYMEALRWLRGETPLHSFTPVQQIGDITSIPDAIANQFGIFTQQLLVALQGEAIYGQIEIALRIAPTLKATPIAKQVTQAGVRAEKSIEEAATAKTQQINEQTTGVENQLRTMASELQQNFGSQIANERHNASSEIRETLNQAT
jgi:hypothetical protein